LEVSLIMDIKGSGGPEATIWTDTTSRFTRGNDKNTGVPPPGDLTFIVPFEVKP